MPGPSHISDRDNDSFKGKENEDNKGGDNSININEGIEECRFKQKSSSKSSSLEEETPKELYKSTKTSHSDSSHDEELPSTSDSCLEELEQPGEETPATVPLTLGSFTFNQTLGKGSFGEVFLATDIIRKECVAIKVSNKYTFVNDGSNFAERDILELSHESPYLIHGLAAFHTEKCIYYVMELATRGNLNNFICDNFPLDTPTIQFIIAEVICGTEFLHKKGIIHRDLKPENILLSAEGHIKITDFGLALMGVYQRTEEEPSGTPLYMAPELFMDQEHGRGVDYFAIGVILYVLYTLEFPFFGKNFTEIKDSVLYDTPFYPEFMTPSTVNILHGLLCKDQDLRLGVIGNVKKYRFFSAMNWEDVEARRVEPPAIMTAALVDLNVDQTINYREAEFLVLPEFHEIFEEFSFICPVWSQHYHPVNDEAIDDDEESF
ncbi:protein kinase C delta type-like [Eleutherodactylus coqui]|uniref:protein kinase C delta type-like n=1 Tax=Eleutherodactylus coqui TaxID=57060 RepID=UPI003461D033